MQQITNTILMIRPVAFRMNEETAINNYFQEDLELKNAEINTKAQKEFDDFVTKLKAVGVNVVVENDDVKMDTPDSIFPNNWVSFHHDGIVTLYPMFAENRRRERREEIINRLESEGYLIEAFMDYTSAEDEGYFLEGTGSLLLDRVHKKAYCALSPRADEELLIEFCEDFEYDPVVFVANQSVNNERLPIYHTNVMMALAENFAVICLETIDDKHEKKNVLRHLKETKKEVITITEAQMHQFAGNMLQVKGDNDKKYMVMSLAAHKSLRPDQISAIEKHCEILSSDLETIETCGGGSARCMMAEVFLPKQT
ncbi:citrulline utilization hydrolase CtlX [Patiriisocius hiemis]|uniref:Arginine deiminase-related protein n=1 Tax=Patiriisocius hiemis TaxID=3075604 RepID=A0ABU2YFS3_9FLAO|nr:arginine deiminase-related protein [Constantimarinum sp. W242]MDT0556075.1 arginine deiminase-related protein [Constantimarinum sp. W242]